MKKSKLIGFVFGAVQNLERYIHRIETLSSEGKRVSPSSLNEQKQVVKNMRRIANRLQLEVARSDWASATRTLQIFYGLDHMVRPDILKSIGALTNVVMPERFEQQQANFH